MHPAPRLLTTLLICLASLLGAATLAACSAPGGLPQQGNAIGTQPSEQAPRMVITDRGTKQWDRPEAFGPVPAHLVEYGQEQCATLNHSGKTHSPVGYHAHAETFDGYPFEDGGFFCRQN